MGFVWPCCATMDIARTSATSCSNCYRTRGLGPEVWRVLAKCHDLRNRAEYAGALDVDERIVADLLSACDTVRTRLDSLVQP